MVAVAQHLANRSKNKDQSIDDVCAGAISDEAACLLCGGCSLGQRTGKDSAGYHPNMDEVVEQARQAEKLRQRKNREKGDLDS